MQFLRCPWAAILSLLAAADDDPVLLCECDDGCACDEGLTVRSLELVV